MFNEPDPESTIRGESSCAESVTWKFAKIGREEDENVSDPPHKYTLQTEFRNNKV